jgi:hypothetical protein
MNANQTLTGFLEETIERSCRDHAYILQCAEEAADLKVKDFLTRMAFLEAELKDHAESCLMEINAQIETEEAIVESYEHF